MADNVTLNAMTGGEVVATDDIGGVHYQIIKLAYGPLNTATLVEASVGMPVVLLAGSAAVGKLAANSGVDIGDVDVTSIAAGDNNIGNVDIVTVPADPFGATADAAVTAGATGSISAKLRSISRDIVSNIVLAAGSNAIGKLAANSGVDIGDVDVTSIAAGDNNIGNVDIVTVPTDPFGATADAAVTAGATGSISAKLRSISRDIVSNIVLAAGTNAIGKLAANSGVDIGDVDVTSALITGATTAHDSTDAGNPIKVGMKAVALKANPTEVAAGDRTDWYADVSGIPFVLHGHPNILSQGLQVTDADGAQTDAAIITAGANVAVVVTKVSVVADNANTGDVSVRIGFGTANTPAADAAQVLLFHPGIAPGSGVIEGTGAGILGIGASGEDVRVTCEDPVGGSVSIIVTYFTTEI